MRNSCLYILFVILHNLQEEGHIKGHKLFPELYNFLCLQESKCYNLLKHQEPFAQQLSVTNQKT
jgi:hypothetical protein